MRNANKMQTKDYIIEKVAAYFAEQRKRIAAKYCALSDKNFTEYGKF